MFSLTSQFRSSCLYLSITDLLVQLTSEFFSWASHFSLFLNVFDWLRILETRHLCTVQILKVAGAPNLYSRVGKPHYEICGYYCCDGSDN